MLAGRRRDRIESDQGKEAKGALIGLGGACAVGGDFDCYHIFTKNGCC